MKLARLEHELSKPINWGKIQFQNTLEREALSKSGKLVGLPKVPPPRSSLREFLEANPSAVGPVDGTPVINQLSEEEQCDFFSRFMECEILSLRGWSHLSETVCRCISITFSGCLLELDLSSSAVQVNHLEILLVRATNLKILRLNNCEKIDNLAMPSIVRLVSKTLTELYTSNVQGMKTECFLTLSGSISKSYALRKLRAFDLGECPLNDRSITAMAGACKQLRFLNLFNGYELTDESIISVATNCNNMQVLNLSGCHKLTTKSIRAVAHHCPHLISLNISRCSKVADKAVRDLSERCLKLQAVNLAGLKRLTEDSIFSLAINCKALLMLNVTGCERITVNGLDALIEGLRYVQKGITFMGFRPKDQHVEEKLTDHLNNINTKAFRDQQENEKNKAQEDAKLLKIDTDLRNKSSSIITDYINRYRLRLRFWHMWRARVKRDSTQLVQRVFRGYRGRCEAARRYEERMNFLRLQPMAIKCQQHTRGHLSRLRNSRISKSIRELYIMREHESQAAVAVRIQAHARRYLAVHKVKAWQELVVRRKINMREAAIVMQRLAKAFVYRLRAERRRQQKLSWELAIRTAEIKIKTFLVDRFRKWKGKLTGDELKKFFRHKWGAAIKIQNNYRAYRQREIMNRVNISIASYHHAAATIQRVFRGCRVLGWRDMRLNVIAAFALDRQFLERKDAIAASRMRYKNYVIENQADSASETDEDDDNEIAWIKEFDIKRKRHFWQNMATNEITYDEPPDKLANEMALIGKRVKVFWTVQNAWYEGFVARYHRRKHRHRIEYDDGDHEWLNMEKECDRVQIQMEDGNWATYFMYRSEGKKQELAKIEGKQEQEQFKQQAFQDALQWKMFVDDHHPDTSMFISTTTGELRVGVSNAGDWVVQDDGFGFPCFYNVTTDAMVFEDPRFLYQDHANLAALKQYIMSELRHSLYFCRHLWDQYENAVKLEDPKLMQRCMFEIKNSPKMAHLASFLIRAKAIYAPISVLDKPMDEDIWKELEYATWISARLDEVRQKLGDYLQNRKDVHNIQVEKVNAKSGQVVHCIYCKRETKKHFDFCKTCGKRQIFM